MKKILKTCFATLGMFSGILLTCVGASAVLRASLLLCGLTWADTNFISGIFAFVGTLAALVVSVSYFCITMEKSTK